MKGKMSDYLIQVYDDVQKVHERLDMEADSAEWKELFEWLLRTSALIDWLEKEGL